MTGTVGMSGQMLSKTLKKLLVVAVICFSSFSISMHVQAVEYTFPEEDGWYQLQSADGSVVYCDTEKPLPCDVPDGTEVKLINHKIARGAPGHITRFTIESESATTMERPEFPSNDIYLLQAAKTNTTSFEMGCPPLVEGGEPDAFVIAVSCSATDSLGAILPHATEIRYADGATGSCTADTEANIQMTITCVRTEYRAE